MVLRVRTTFFCAAFLCSGCLTAPPIAGSNSESPSAPDAANQIAWAGTSVATAYPIAQTRAFEFVQSGRRIGRSWGRYMGSIAGEGGLLHRFETRIELEVPGREPLRSAGELVLDEQGNLIRGFERSNAAELTFLRKDGALEISDGRRTESVGYTPDEEPTAVMAHSAMFHQELFLRLRELPVGTTQLRLVSISGGMPTEWTGDARLDRGAVIIETNLGETITLRDGLLESVRVQASGLEVVAANDAWPAWEIEGPRRLTYTPAANATFSIREVELPAGKEEPALAGEVLIPNERQGPAPAVLWVGPTGREDRHGFAGPPPVDLGGHEITDALAQAGFVVLRFDERGRGKSEPGVLSFVGQVHDAKRALGTLMVQEEVDPDRVILLGHGEGGLRQLALASAQGEGLVGVALLGTPGRPYREVFLDQAEAALADVPPELRAGAQAQQQLMVDAIESGSDVPPELAAEAQWLREMFAMRPAQLVGRLKVPLFLAQGDMDFEVNPNKDFPSLQRAARAAKVKTTAHRYPKLDHLFKPESERSTPARYLEPNRRVDEAFLADLIGWAQARTTK